MRRQRVNEPSRFAVYIVDATFGHDDIVIIGNDAKKEDRQIAADTGGAVRIGVCVIGGKSFAELADTKDVAEHYPLPFFAAFFARFRAALDFGFGR